MTDNYVVFNAEKNVGYLHAVRQPKLNTGNEIHYLHGHDNIYEIIMLINGDLEFHVEGSIYKPKKYDIVIVRPKELHELISISNEPYKRFTLHITQDFFLKYNCERFEEIFNNRRLGENNLIPSNFVEENLKDLCFKIEKYFEKGEYQVANAVLIEFLYILNTANGEPTKPTNRYKRINDIIDYINENLTEQLTLEDVAEQFFIDKFYLCKVFKKNTSFTINQYISYKRVLLARELHDKGMSLMDASSNAGFNSYSNFYKAHIKFLGTSPRAKDLEE